MLRDFDRFCNKRFIEHLFLINKEPHKTHSFNKEKLEVLTAVATNKDDRYTFVNQQQLIDRVTERNENQLTFEEQQIIDQFEQWANNHDLVLASYRRIIEGDQFDPYEPGLLPQFKTRLKQILINKSLSISIEQFTNNLKQLFYLNHMFIMGADNDPKRPSILLKLLQNQATYPLMGMDVDISLVLKRQFTNSEDIYKAGKYLLLPHRWDKGMVKNQIEAVINNLKKQITPQSNQQIELVIPINKGEHWVLLAVSLKNKQIIAIEESDSIGGPSENVTKIAQNKHAQILTGLFSSIDTKYFAHSFDLITIKRNEQRGGSCCMDYTIQHALRKLGRSIYNEVTEQDLLNLSYNFYAGSNDRKLRNDICSIINLKLKSCDIQTKELPISTQHELNNQWDRILGRKSIASINFNNKQLVTSHQQNKSFVNTNPISTPIPIPKLVSSTTPPVIVPKEKPVDTTKNPSTNLTTKNTEPKPETTDTKQIRINIGRDKNSLIIYLIFNMQIRLSDRKVFFPLDDDLFNLYITQSQKIFLGYRNIKETKSDIVFTIKARALASIIRNGMYSPKQLVGDINKWQKVIRIWQDKQLLTKQQIVSSCENNTDAEQLILIGKLAKPKFDEFTVLFYEAMEDEEDNECKAKTSFTRN